MKTRRVINLVAMSLLLSGWTSVYAQDDRIEVPGDHFSLEGALELFKKSASPEEFERLLNSPNTEVNNLDLNGDGDIDYIKVIDRNQGNVHAFILQAVVSANENQDVAVIELEKLANRKAVLQITGDADIYGIETIIEPTEEVRVNAGTSTNRTVVNVWTWPSVQYIYSPYYYGWASTWDWYYRPIWWHTWRPINYYSYYSYWQPYRPYYSVCYTHRVGYAQQIYQPYRSTSAMVYNRHHNQITNYRSSPRYTADFNRGRDNDSRYNHSSSNRGNDYNQHSDNNGRSNSRSYNNGQRQQSDYNRNRSTGNGMIERNNSNGEEKRNHSTSSTWRQNTDNRQHGNSEVLTRQHSNTFENRSVPDNNRTQSGWQRNNSDNRQTMKSRPNFRNQESRSHQSESRPSNDSRSNQHGTAIQQDRGRSSSGNGDMRQSGSHGSNGGENKSGGQRRGRN